MKVLAIGAHPDDIELFMLGTLLSYKARNDEVFVAVATDGAAGKVLDYSDLANTRKLETEKGLHFFGKPYFFNFPDGKLSVSENALDKIQNYIQTSRDLYLKRYFFLKIEEVLLNKFLVLIY